ncbi:MAG: threonine synthase [Parvibaculaceae bacterium]
MRYISTRGGAPAMDFEGVLLAGLAADGGLYVPETWPSLAPEALATLRGRPYAEVALAVIRPFVGASLPEAELKAIIADTYAGFRHTAVTPLKQLDADRWLLELFHGPTLAFKDVAMQLLARLMDRALKNRGRQATIVVATSGDTGGAAVEAFRETDRVSLFVLHPKGRVSDVQRRQMTTVLAPHIHNIAIEGTFDDAQALVKAMFADQAFRERNRLAAVNSINWARIVAQAVYYVASALALGAPSRSLSFSVPTGNFGDVYAGFVAKRLGIPIDRLVVATNVNDILDRAMRTGRYEVRGVEPTESPSMDIQVSSNFERLLFEASGRDAGEVRGLMASLSQSGAFTIPDETLARIQANFDSMSLDAAGTRAELVEALAGTGELIDPHTAVGCAAARRFAVKGTPMVTLSTAHPAKFPDAVEAATGVRPELPPRLSDLKLREERFAVLPNALAEVQAFIDARAAKEA